MPLEMRMVFPTYTHARTHTHTSWKADDRALVMSCIPTPNTQDSRKEWQVWSRPYKPPKLLVSKQDTTVTIHAPLRENSPAMVFALAVGLHTLWYFH